MCYLMLKLRFQKKHFFAKLLQKFLPNYKKIP